MRGRRGPPFGELGRTEKTPGVRDRGAGPQGRPVPPLPTWQLPGLAFHPSEKKEEPAAGSKLR